MRPMYVTMMLMLLAGLSARSADAFVEFHKEWVKMYVDMDDDSEENQDYIKMVAKGKYRCLVCHQGKKKTNHNLYGHYFVGELGKDDKKDTDKIVEWLTKVGEMPVDPEDDPKDEDTLKFNDLIERKEFPGGKLEDLEEEPKKEESEE